MVMGMEITHMVLTDMVMDMGMVTAKNIQVMSLETHIIMEMRNLVKKPHLPLLPLLPLLIQLPLQLQLIQLPLLIQLPQLTQSAPLLENDSIQKIIPNCYTKGLFLIFPIYI